MRKEVDQKVDKDRFDELRSDFREHIEENRHAHELTIGELGQINKILGKIEGKLSK